MLILALGALALLGAPLALGLLIAALIQDRRSSRLPPASHYQGRTYVPGYRTKKGRYVRSHYKRR